MNEEEKIQEILKEKSKYWCEKGHFNANQLLKVKELVEQYKPNYVLETGFCTGRSCVSVLLHTNIKKMISIDIDLDYMYPEGRLMSKLLTDDFKQLTIIENDSRKTLNKEFFEKEFPDGIDWATIDGTHTFPGCLFELTSVLPYLNNNGIIIVDDYKSCAPDGWPNTYIRMAVDSFRETSGKNLKFSEWFCNGKGMAIFTKLGEK